MDRLKLDPAHGDNVDEFLSYLQVKPSRSAELSQQQHTGGNNNFDKQTSTGDATGDARLDRLNSRCRVLQILCIGAPPICSMQEKLRCTTTFPSSIYACYAAEAFNAPFLDFTKKADKEQLYILEKAFKEAEANKDKLFLNITGSLTHFPHSFWIMMTS